MVDLLTATGISLLIGLVPTALGAFPLLLAQRILDKSRWVFASLALGIFMNFFLDFISNASGLGVSLGLRFSGTQILLLLSFSIGAIGIAFIKGSFRKSGEGNDLVRLAYLVALALSFHSLGEGLLIGSDLRIAGVSTDIGTLAQGISFFLHKVFEGFGISVFFLLAFRGRDFAATTLLSSLPVALGAPLGLSGIGGELTTYLFAVSAGAIIFLLPRYGKIAFSSQRDVRAMLLVVVGFLAVYSAALIHNTQI